MASQYLYVASGRASNRVALMLRELGFLVEQRRDVKRVENQFVVIASGSRSQIVDLSLELDDLVDTVGGEVGDSWYPEDARSAVDTARRFCRNGLSTRHNRQWIIHLAYQLDLALKRLEDLEARRQELERAALRARRALDKTAPHA